MRPRRTRGDTRHMSTTAPHHRDHRGRSLPDALRLGPVHLTVPTWTGRSPSTRRSIGLTLTAATVDSAAGRRRRGPARARRGARRPRPAGRHAGLYHFALLTRRARSWPARPCGSPPPARRSRARRTTASPRRSTCPTPTATASSSPPTARASWPDLSDPGCDGGPAPLDMQACSSSWRARSRAQQRRPAACAWATCTCTWATSSAALALLPRRARLRGDGNLGHGRVHGGRRLPPPPRLQHLARRASPPVPDGMLGLRQWTVLLRRPPTRRRARARGRRGRASRGPRPSGLRVRDPWNNALVFQAR